VQFLLLCNFFSQLTFYIKTITFWVSFFSSFTVFVYVRPLYRLYLYNTRTCVVCVVCVVYFVCVVCVCVQIMDLFSIVILVDSHV
jgi:hypothetical protein